MKRIILMRHGNAESSYQKNDFDRDLTKYGEKEVSINIEKFNTLLHTPELVYVSKANRTQQTFNIFVEKIKYYNKHITDEGLYNFHNSTDFLINYIKYNDNSLNSIMFIGHNPTLSNILQMLTGDLSIYMDTASIFVIDFDVDNWENIELKKGNIFFSTN